MTNTNAPANKLSCRKQDYETAYKLLMEAGRHLKAAQDARKAALATYKAARDALEAEKYAKARQW